MAEASLLGLRGKVAVVTGGSRGIGAASARMLAGQGTGVVLLGRTVSPELLAVAEELSGRVEVLALACDSADGGQIAEVYRRVRAEFGRLDVLVNNAGVMSAGRLGMIVEDDLDRMLAVNVKGPTLHVQAAARLMRRSGGSIINLTSIMGVSGAAGYAVYSASKAAVVGLTRSAAKELAPRGIRVNAVAPGFIATDMTAALSEDAKARSLGSIGMGRAGTVEDVARVVLFLAGDLSGYVTGQVLGVDGGMLI